MRSRRRLGGLVVAAVLAVASCGSDGPKTLSEDDFVSQANAVCRAADRSLADLDPEDTAYYNDVGDVIQEGIDGLSALRPPKALQGDVGDLLDNLDGQSTQAARLAKAVKSGDDAAVSAASDKLQGLQADSDDLTDSLGIHSCFGADSVQLQSTLSADQLTEQMNAICASADASLRDLDTSEFDTYFGEAAAVFEGLVKDLGQLAPPQASSADFADFLVRLGDVGKELRVLGESGSFDFDPLTTAIDQAGTLATSLGADSCAQLLSNEGGDGGLGS